MKIPCTALPYAFILGVIVALILYYVVYVPYYKKANYREGNKPGIKMYLQEDTSRMDFPITNNTGYRNPTVGLPIIPISTSSSISNGILAPARAKSVLPDVQETIIYRGPGDQARNLPRTTTGAVMENERALSSTHNIAGLE